MRNQRRKLYPDLFKTFRMFLDSVNDSNKYILYCHTSYPDMGWDIPELLNKYSLSSHVYFTYICPVTNSAFSSLFDGAITNSPFTGQINASISNVKFGASYKQLSEIINMFDIYIQYANSEGFGLPQVEAAACGVPVMATDYSAMETVIRKLEGIPVKPKALYKELETGCNRAVPDNELAVKLLKEFFSKTDEERSNIGMNTRRLFDQHFQWDQSGAAWEKYFDSIDLVPEEKTWLSPPRYRKPSPMLEDHEHKSPLELSRWLISQVLCDENKLDSFMESRLTRDLTYKTTTATTGGMYFNESSAAFEGNNVRSHFDFNKAYNHFLNLCNRHNFWENQRAKAFNL